MRPLIQSVITTVLSTYFCAAQAPVTRIDITHYPHQVTGSEVAMGAEVLSQDAVSRKFTTELNRGYLVIEVGIFPDARSLELSPRDFALKLPDGTAVKAAGPEVVSRVLQESAPAETTVTVVPEVGVSYETGTGIPPDYPAYDPRVQRYPRRGLSTRVGVGVGVGQDRPGSTERDRQVMEVELKDKGLPEGPTTVPVAGYLYFRAKDIKPQSSFVLHYSGSIESVSLALQAP